MESSTARGPHEAASASAPGAPELPATAEPSPTRAAIGLGSLVQVATEHEDAKGHHGAWGTVTALLPDSIIMFQCAVGHRMRRVQCFVVPSNSFMANTSNTLEEKLAEPSILGYSSIR